MSENYNVIYTFVLLLQLDIQKINYKVKSNNCKIENFLNPGQDPSST